MSILDLSRTNTDHAAPTPTDRLLTASLLLAPPIYLLADSLYASRGWDDPAAGGVHVIGALLYGFVLLRLTSWARGRLAAGMLFAAVAGTAGNVAYGFNTIQVSLGGIDLVDASGPAVIIKPLGLFFPLALFVGGVIALRVGQHRSGVLLMLSGAIWPIAHNGNIGWLAVAVNVLLVVAILPLASARPTPDPTAA